MKNKTKKKKTMPMPEGCRILTRAEAKHLKKKIMNERLCGRVDPVVTVYNSGSGMYARFQYPWLQVIGDDINESYF